jgi:hypothetical protein
MHADLKADREYRRTRLLCLAGFALVAVLAALVVGVAVSSAAERFTVPQAKAVFHDAEPHGRFHGCTRQAERRLLCRVDVREVATHEWEDPATGEWEVVERKVFYVRARVPVVPGGVRWLEAEV